MDAVIRTLMLVLAASRLDGIEVLVSIPEDTFYNNDTITITITMKDVLNEVMDGSAFKPNAKPASTSEPALVSSSQKPTTQSEGSKSGT